MSREPDRDWRGRAGRLEISAANERMWLVRLVLRVVTLPFWLPFYIYGHFKRRRLMIAFAHEMARNRVVGDTLLEEMAARWVELQPQRYPLGRYDPKFDRVRKQFREILERRRR